MTAIERGGYEGAKGHDCRLCAACAERYAGLARRQLLTQLRDRLQQMDRHAYNVHDDYYVGFDSACIGIQHLIDELERQS